LPIAQIDDEHIGRWFVPVGGCSWFLRFLRAPHAIPHFHSTPSKPHTYLAYCRYTGALLLSQQANTSASEHRDALVNKLMVATGLTADQPVPPYLRRDLPLFFETFEAYKAKAASGSHGTTMPPAAMADTAEAVTATPAKTSQAAKASFDPEAAHSVMGAVVIKVSGSTIYHLIVLSGFPRAVFPS
jgi:hypothetical protein